MPERVIAITVGRDLGGKYTTRSVTVDPAGDRRAHRIYTSSSASAAIANAKEHAAHFRVPIKYGSGVQADARRERARVS